MADTSSIRPRVQKALSDAVSRLSTMFMELSAAIKEGRNGADTQKSVDALFKSVLESHRLFGSEASGLLDDLDRLERKSEEHAEERRRLEILYTSGIVFSSETERQSLMEKAVEIVVREIGADAGFIVLCGAKGEPDAVFTQNMDPDDQGAREMSTSVIKSTIAGAKPTQVDDPATEVRFARQQSILRLGITAVLCVPLVSGVKTLGAVYLDRRSGTDPFTETDLVFLLSFARQIVRGLEISSEISELEQKLLAEPSMKPEEFRKAFVCPEIVGSSRTLLEPLRIASRIAPTDASVLVLGENGTGKDLLAHAIHRNSPRADKPFVTINCGAIPHDLLESELFGYESGAFTGATKTKPGKMELANGGTLFFDEIGELSINLQAKLLRVIQSREIERLGGTNPRRIDVRIISATNKEPREMISEGRFREDLYYRLKVIEISLPPLRDHREDIADLAHHFLQRYAPQGTELSENALTVLEQYHWPGNIRELENVVHRCAVLAKGPLLDVADLPPELVEQATREPSVKMGRPLSEAETEFRRMYIIKTLRQAGSAAEAARLLGINRTHLYRLLSQLGIEY